MQKINTKLFTLDEVYSTISHYDTFSTLDYFINMKSELEGQLVKIYTNIIVLNQAQRKELIDLIKLQIIFIEQNIKTFENALLCHETNVSEMRTIMGELTKFWLN